jgi:hypothetical protein
MNREQKRNNQKKMYSKEDCMRMIINTMRDSERKYDIRYSMCLATALSAPPLNFGPKRVCRVVKLFFDQIEALRIGTVTEDQIKEEAEKLGVVVVTNEDKTEIYIDPQIKKKRR